MTAYLDRQQLLWFRHRLKAWAKDHFRDFPWRHTTDPYALLVAEFLLQQTEASRTVPTYEEFLNRYPTIEDLATATVEDIFSLLEPLGFHFRAARLHQTANIIRDRYGGQVPDREGELLKLPGVGDYIARSVCTNAFGQSLAILDTNVARILERFFGLKGGRVKSRDKMLWAAAMEAAPDSEVSRWNLTLLDFGALVCTALKPKCGGCPLREQCHYLLTNENSAAKSLIEFRKRQETDETTEFI